MKITALIPAFNPTSQLIDLVIGLQSSIFSYIIVVDDGSRPDSADVFEDVRKNGKVTVLRHAVNLGKGAALKTGLNYAYCTFPDDIGVVTLDADGQHLVEDAVKVARRLQQQPHHLVMGVRTFEEEVPLRSRLGNSATRHLFRLLVGQNITDTQTGLRAIPRNFIPTLLRIHSTGYEFELDMLLACKYSGRSIVEQTIQTIYLEGNKSSHFNPIVDSTKIYFVLFRFSIASLLSAFIDNTVFIVIYSLNPSILLGQATGRLLATMYNYIAVRGVVFRSKESISRTLPQYISLVCISGAVSYFSIKMLVAYTTLSVIAAKLLVESVVFLANFAIQRDFIFTGPKKELSST